MKLTGAVLVAAVVVAFGAVSSDSTELSTTMGDTIMGTTGWQVPSMPTVLPLNDPGEGCWHEHGEKVCGLWGLRPVSA